MLSVRGGYLRGFEEEGRVFARFFIQMLDKAFEASGTDEADANVLMAVATRAARFFGVVEMDAFYISETDMGVVKIKGSSGFLCVGPVVASPKGVL